jgi:hypothetical protein
MAGTSRSRGLMPETKAGVCSSQQSQNENKNFFTTLTIVKFSGTLNTYNQGLISPTFYEQLLLALIPKAQKDIDDT